MKILCQHKSCGEHFRLSGFGNALIAAGHQFSFWKPEDKPAFDAFDEFRPDLFISTTFDLSNAMMKCIAERPEMHVILKGSNWGPIDKEIDKSVYPVVTVTEEEKAKIEKLKRETGKPDFVFCHYHEKRLDETMSGWNEIGVEPVALMNAADVIDYKQGNERPELKSDVSFVGGYWGYKARNLAKFILPLCNPVGRFNVKIWGNQPWPVPQYLGYVETSDVPDIIRSAGVCPSVSEPHSTEFGFDVIERPFKIISAGGVCISDRVASLEYDVFRNDQLPFFDDAEELSGLVEYLRKDDGLREDYRCKQREVVLRGHTYFHRMSNMFFKLGLRNEAGRMIDVYEKKFLPEDLRLHKLDPNTNPQ